MKGVKMIREANWKPTIMKRKQLPQDENTIVSPYDQYHGSEKKQ